MPPRECLLLRAYTAVADLWDQTNMISPLLDRELKPYEDAMLSEEILEGRHRDATLVNRTGNNQKLPWTSATIDLDQDIDKYKGLTPGGEAMQVFAACWKKWKLILPDKAKVYSDIRNKAAKPKGRMHRQDVIEQVYRIGKHGTKDWSTLEEMFANDDDDDGGGGKGARKTDSQTLKLD